MLLFKCTQCTIFDYKSCLELGKRNIARGYLSVYTYIICNNNNFSVIK